MKNRRIKWIFFDIGNVINDESNYDEWVKKTIIKRARKIKPEITEQDFHKARIEASKMPDSLTKNILEILTGNKEEAEKIYNEMNPRKQIVLQSLPIRPEAKETLEKLSKEYFLGIIANQPSGIKDWLRQEGILGFFKVVGIAGDYGLQKPDPEFFKAVLKDAQTEFSESAMIDDNIERSLDIAKQLGMTTIFYNTNHRKDIPKNTVDFTIYSLTDLLKIF